MDSQLVVGLQMSIVLLALSGLYALAAGYIARNRVIKRIGAINMGVSGFAQALLWFLS